MGHWDAFIQDDMRPHHFPGVFPVVFQDLGPPSQAGDSDGLSHQQCCALGFQLHMQSATT